jgi:hypothetical protein
MFRATIALIIATAACARAASPDTQALQALVAEIRQLRQDMQATTLVTQRVQIVLEDMLVGTKMQLERHIRAATARERS